MAGLVRRRPPPGAWTRAGGRSCVRRRCRAPPDLRSSRITS